MTSILFSRSRRTASIRSGRAGGLAGKLGRRAVAARHGGADGAETPDGRTNRLKERPCLLKVCPIGADQKRELFACGGIGQTCHRTTRRPMRPRPINPTWGID